MKFDLDSRYQYNMNLENGNRGVKCWNDSSKIGNLTEIHAKESIHLLYNKFRT